MGRLSANPNALLRSGRPGLVTPRGMGLQTVTSPKFLASIIGSMHSVFEVCYIEYLAAQKSR